MKYKNTFHLILAFIIFPFIIFLQAENSPIIFGTREKKIEFIEKVLKNKDKTFLEELIRLLEDPDKEIRVLASKTLYEIGDITFVYGYRKALGDPYWLVRLYGIKGLVKWGDSDILNDLYTALDDSYWQVRYYAIIGIGKYGNEESIKKLLDCLKDKNGDIVKITLITLKRLMWKNVTRFNFKSLSDNEIQQIIDCFKQGEDIKLLTISLFEKVEDKRVIPHLISLLGDESDEVKIRSLWTLENFKIENYEEIVGLLNEPSVKVKVEAIKTIVRLKMEEGVEGLISGLKDENETVRLYSLWGLKKFRDPVSYNEIVNCLCDKSEIIKGEAINIIEEISDPLLIPIIENFIKSKNVNIEAKKIAIVELGKIGKISLPQSKEILRRCLKDSNSEIRFSAIEGFYLLDRFDDQYIRNLVYMEKEDPTINIRRISSKYLKKIIDELIEKVDSFSIDDRTLVLNKIDNLIGTKQINRLLLKMFKSKFPEVREKAISILREKPEKIFATNVRELIKEPDIEIKKLCAIVLGEMRDRNSISILKSGLSHYDSEYQLICANALTKMGREDGLNIILNNIDNENISLQKIAVESLVNLNKKEYSYLLLKKLYESELEIKLLSAWGLSRLGNDIGFEMLVRFSQVNVEPIRTIANYYLKDNRIPSDFRKRVPKIIEEIYRSKLGVQEVRPKMIYGFRTDFPIEIDGNNNEGIWRIIESSGNFIFVENEKILSDIQTKVSCAYDKENIYFLFVCEHPSKNEIKYDSRDFITISINPHNFYKEWYQFVFHPLCDLKYSYIWKFYKDEDVDKSWSSNWKVATNISKEGNYSRWIAEISIPLRDIKVEKVEKGMRWGINFHREIDNYTTSTWTGRIDIPEQFGVIIFEESP